MTGLPDGWEVEKNLNPLDNGIYNFATGTLGDPKNGAAGDPDNDLISNAAELSAGTHPNQPNSGLGVGPGRGNDQHRDVHRLDLQRPTGTRRIQ